MHNIGATHISSKHGVSPRDQTTHNQRVSGTMLKSRTLELDRTRLSGVMVISISCASPLAEICHTNNTQTSFYNKNKKNNQVHLKQANNQSSNNKITITQHRTHIFRPQCPKHYCWWSLRCLSVLPVSHGIAAARELQPILLNEARLTPHKQRMDRAIERLGRHRLNCSFIKNPSHMLSCPVFRSFTNSPLYSYPVYLHEYL